MSTITEVETAAGTIYRSTPAAAPVLTLADVERIGADSVRNLAELVFRARHRDLPQYAGWFARQHEVALLGVIRDPHIGDTFSRYEVDDVVIAWRDRWVGWGPFPEWTAYCPRVGWNVQMTPGSYAVIG